MKNLSEKSLLVHLNIKAWSARKYDRKVTDEVNQKHNAKDAGRFNKVLVAKEHLQAIQQIANEARAFHYDNTLPWSDNGERLLPADNYFEYIQKVAEIKDKYESKVGKLILAYPAMIEQAKVELNGLFNEKDYPLNIGERFALKASFMPVPDVQDIRINLSEKEVNEIRQNVESEINDRFAAAQKSIYDRIIEQLKHMHDRLSNTETVFRNSLFDNILSLVELLPRLNVTGDPNIKTLCKDLRSLYIDPEIVRESKKLRADKAKEVESMLSKIDAFLKP